jgi:hypothetical protein
LHCRRQFGPSASCSYQRNGGELADCLRCPHHLISKTQRCGLRFCNGYRRTKKIDQQRHLLKNRTVRSTQKGFKTTNFSTDLSWLLTFGLFVLGICVAWAWLMPIEYFQNLFWRTAGTDPYRQFEAIGRAEAACWLVRIAGVLALVALVAILSYVDNASRFAYRLAHDIIEATTGPYSFATNKSITTILLRLALLAWFAMACLQWVAALDRRLTDWPYYRFRSGSQVLPNISDANRDVIRYLREATPSKSRILIVSDQKLFFLSYYLLPRRLYHKIHPDSEFVIPLANQQRRLAAYHYGELDPSWIDKGQFDYILEYFEHPDSFTKDQVTNDTAWLNFVRKAHRDPTYLPSFFVRLRPQQEKS